MAFLGQAPVIDVQTHFIDPTRWARPGAAPLAGFLQMVDATRWGVASTPVSSTPPSGPHSYSVPARQR